MTSQAPPTSAILALEARIGFPSNRGQAEIITQAQRRDVVSWLMLHDISKTGAEKASLESLGKAYGKASYLQGWLANERVTARTSTRRGKFNQPPQDLNLTLGEAEAGTPEPEQNLPLSTSQPRPEIETLPAKEVVKTIENIVKSQLETWQKKQVSDLVSLSDNLLALAEKTVAESLESQKAKLENYIRKASEEVIFSTLAKAKAKVQEDELETKTQEQADQDSTSSDPASSSPHLLPFIPKIDPNYHFDPYATRVIRSALSMSENVYAYGDTGCGKTTHIEQVCAVLGRGLSRINPHDGVTREMFLGGMKLINGETKFIEGALPTAMRLGLVFLVDEISFLPPNLTAILNPIGEKGGKLYIPETSEWISPAPGFCLFATDNTGGKGDRTGQYTGTEVQNTATLDRFAFCLKMDYLPQDKEREMLQKRFPNVSSNEILQIHSLATETRSAFSRGELSITFSTRKLIKFFDQRQAGFNLLETLTNTLLSWLDDDDKQLVKTTIDRLGIDLSEEENSPDQIQSHATTLDNIIQRTKHNIVTYANNNRKVEAVKELKNAFRLGLKEAKDLIESYMEGLVTIDQLIDSARTISNNSNFVTFRS